MGGVGKNNTQLLGRAFDLPAQPFFWGISLPDPLPVGGLEHVFFIFPYVRNVIIPTDEVIFSEG